MTKMLTKIIIKLIIICSLITFIWCSKASSVKYQTDCKKIEVNRTEIYNKTRRDVPHDNLELFHPKDNYYQCPGDKYPNDFLDCCGTNECCQIKVSYIIYPISNNDLPYVILVAVLFACFFTIVTLGLCCFWSICPLYNSCRIRYYRDEASCTNKFGGETINTSMMPDEDIPTSNTLVIAKKFDSDLIEERKVIHGKADLIESTKITKNTNEFAV